MAQAAKATTHKKSKADKAYSRVGEGDDQRAFDDWNDEWVKKFWAGFLKELDRGKK